MVPTTVVVHVESAQVTGTKRKDTSSTISHAVSKRIVHALPTSGCKAATPASKEIGPEAVEVFGRGGEGARGTALCSSRCSTAVDADHNISMTRYNNR